MEVERHTFFFPNSPFSINKLTMFAKQNLHTFHFKSTIMKKAIISLLALALAHTTSAQISCLVIPKVETGIASIDFMDIDENKDAFHFNTGVTIGIAQQAQNGRNFAGIHLARNGYSYIEKDLYNDEYLVIMGSSLVGAQFLHHANLGLIFGGIVGFNIWDKEYSYDGDNYDFPLDNNFTAKAQFGYSWTHVAIMLESGYNYGFELGLNVSFPIFFAKE